LIVTFLRSSSITTYRNCPHQYLLNYVMGLPSLSGIAAAKGNVCHKAMECLAWKSMMRRDGKATYEDETFGELVVDDITTEWAVEASYEYYKRIEHWHKWKPVDFDDCMEWTKKFLTINNGYFDPANMDIVSPEVRFDITIKKPWARYSYKLGDETIEGYLGLKGTVDLLVRDRHDPNVLEYIDYKTGKQQDFASGELKDYDSLMHDKQLLLYYYALSQMYPNKQLMSTIIFVKFDGAFRMPFGADHLVEAEQMLREMFETIRNDKRPALIEPKTAKCWSLCTYNKPSPWNPKLSTCEFLRRSVREIGVDATVLKYGKPGAFNAYGAGGGRQASE
jgi:ATP-dependent helicase/DNAse subunit B